MSFELLKDKETMVTELNYINIANCGLKNSVTRSFSALKHYKQFFSLCQKLFFCDIWPFHPHAFNY
jgi:hypothetical protein